MSTQEIPISLETATGWARSNREWDKVYRYLFLHPKDFFVISPPRRWPIAHQVVYHGDVDLFKRILALFSDDQIDIHSQSADNKTLLIVATEKRQAHPQMYTYVDHLFAQDKLIEQAKQSNWRLVTELLEKKRDLINEKPPYSPYFLLHFVVENGDAQILQDLLDRFQFLTNVLNTKNETPLDMAIRLNKYDMCSILRPRTVARPGLTQNQPPTPPIEHLHRPNERVTSHTPIDSMNQSAQYQSPASMPALSTKAIDPKTQLPCIGFGNVVLDISQNGDFTFESSALFNSTRNQPVQLPPLPRQQHSKASSGVQHNFTKKSIVGSGTLTNMDPPTPPTPPTTSTSSNTQLMKNLTCTLTRQVFVDPVIATDGKTYERAAILEWVNANHSSPITGAPMDATFVDNTEIKEIIRSMRQQS